MGCFFDGFYSILSQNLFCCNLRCFVAKPVLLRFTHFLCGDKLRPKCCPWRKMTNIMYAYYSIFSPKRLKHLLLSLWNWLMVLTGRFWQIWDIANLNYLLSILMGPGHIKPSPSIIIIIIIFKTWLMISWKISNF